jgi:photosystem II stability/assembly factor-like uncharacterized protein
MRRITAVLLISLVAGLLCAVAAVLAPPASALSSTGDGTWFWRSPQPQGNWLNAVCAAGDSLWTVGDAGTILHSADDGASWAPQASGTSLALNDVTFTDSLNGWAVGGDEGSDPSPTAGVVLHTTDGGLTWGAQSVPATSGLWGVGFVDALRGWAVGDFGTVLHTTDGGLTWHKRVTQPWESLTSVTFSDLLHGLLGGPSGAVLCTSDGGAHWRRVPLGSWAHGGFIIKPVFADAAHGWAILQSQNESIDNGSGRVIVATSDGGAHWRPLTTPQDLEFTSLAIGHDGSLVAAATDIVRYSTLFVETTDGGLHWSRQYADVMLAQDMCTDAGGLCAVGEGVLTRADGGPWLPRSSWPLALTQLVMQDDRHGIGLLSPWWWEGSGTAVARTTDGVNWDVVGKLPLSVAEGMAFSDAQHGWVIGASGRPDPYFGTGRIYATADGGLTWQKQSADLPDTRLTGVSFADAQHGWTCGVTVGTGSLTSSAVLLATTDGGQTWQREKLPTGFLALGVDFASPQDGCAVGLSDHGQVSAHTTDGGAHWTLSSTALESTVLQTVTFVDSQHGWATGYAGASSKPVVLATTDAGQTWVRQTAAGSSVSYNGVAFVSPERGWLFLDDPGGGVGDSIWQTTDGGTHWLPEDGGVAAGVMSASVVGDAVYIAGEEGFFSTVDRAGDSAPPATYDDFDGRYHRSDVAIHLVASDIGGGTVAATQYRLDSDPAWHDYSGAITFAVPADHTNDGIHKLYYRSIDSNGNVEPSAWWWLRVPIDTLGPSTQAGPPANVVRGGIAHFAYRVSEKTSPRVRVAIHVLSASGRSVGTFVRNSPVNRPELLSARCGLRPGRYRYAIYARDLAGNRAVHVGWGRLIVKARGSAGSAPVAAVRRIVLRPALPVWLAAPQWSALRGFLGLPGPSTAPAAKASGPSRPVRVDHAR